MKLWYFVKVVASYALAKKGIDELLVIKINDVEFRESRDAPRNCFSRFSRIHVIFKLELTTVTHVTDNVTHVTSWE